MQSLSLIEPKRKMSVYKKRNIIICSVVVIFVIGTMGFTIGIYASGARLYEDEDLKTNERAVDPGETNNVLNQSPNILFLVADDLRPTLGCYGDLEALTPNIDQIAKGGFLFMRAYAQQAVCGPSRTSFLTSRRPDTLHVYGNDNSYTYWRNTVGNFTTLPQYFKEHGYHTASIGKVFHNGLVSNKTDDYPYSWSEKPYHPSTIKYKMAEVCPSVDGKLHMNLVCPVEVENQPEGTLPDMQSTEEAKLFLKSQANRLAVHGNETKPFFLGVGYYKPHIPLKFPKKYLGLYPLDDIQLAPNRKKPSKLPPVAWNPFTDIREREDIQALNLSFPYGPIPDNYQKFIKQGYYASVTYVDDLIGELLETLEETGLANNTVIVFLGDHGWALGEHQEWSKYSNYDIALRVPLIINVPSSWNKSYRYISPFSNHSRNDSDYDYPINDLIELVDIFPSLVDIAGLPVLPKCSSSTSNISCTEGQSFAPWILKKTYKTESPFTAAFSQYPRPSMEPSENSDQPSLQDTTIMGYTCTDTRYRITEWLPFDNEQFVANWSHVLARELYDHSVDPNENNNLAGDPKQVPVIEKLSKRLSDVFEKP